MVYAFTIPSIVVTLVSLIILWIIVSIPVWLAGKAVKGKHATFGKAMLATLAGPIVYFVVTFLVEFFVSPILGSNAFLLAYILALIAWIWVYKASFETGWVRAILIAIMAWVFFVVLVFITAALFGAAYPSPFFPPV